MALRTEDASMVADEFPRYPIHALPTDIPDWLTCCAWHNDACPIWGDASYVAGEGGIALAIDYPRADDREFEESKRFGVWRTNALSEQVGDTFDSDDWEAVKVELERLRTEPTMQDLLNDALNGALVAVQQRLGVSESAYADMFFADDDKTNHESAFASGMVGYVRAELDRYLEQRKGTK